MKIAPMRLRVRVAVLVCLMALGGFTVTVGVGSWIILEAEDALIARTIDAATNLAPTRENGPHPSWLAVVPDAVGIRRLTGLEQPPESPGWYEVFGNEARTRARVVDGLVTRLATWFNTDREREYRLFVPDSSSSAADMYLVADLTQLEFTESRVMAISRYIWWLAVAVACGALLVVTLVVRWTLAPVLNLARRVRESCDMTEEPIFADDTMPPDEIGMLARELDQAYARARAAMTRERLFIAECSHELRTPLSTLKSAHTLMMEVGDEPATRHRVLKRMQRSIGRMERLVYDFLVLAREGRHPTSGGGVPLRIIVHEVVEEQAALLTDCTTEVELDIPESVTVTAPRDVVLSIVHNLVHNAFKHAPHGHLRMSWYGEDDLLRFEDDGPGFPDDSGDHAPVGMHDHLSSPRGYGLGLLLTQRLCQTQGWQLNLGRSGLGGARIDLAFLRGRASNRPT